MSLWFETQFPYTGSRVLCSLVRTQKSRFHELISSRIRITVGYFQICSVNSARKYAEIRLAPIDPAPLLAGKLCLLHRHGNKGVELCSVSRQTPWRTIRSIGA